MKEKLNEVFSKQFEIEPPDSSFNCTMGSCYYSDIHDSKIIIMGSPKSFDQILLDLDKDEKKNGIKSYPITINGVKTRYQEFKLKNEETGQIIIGQTYLVKSGENTLMTSVSFPEQKRAELELKIQKSLETITERK